MEAIMLAQATFPINGLIQIIIGLVVVGLILWLVESQLPIDPTFKVIIRVVLIVAVLLWLLRCFGMF